MELIILNAHTTAAAAVRASEAKRHQGRKRERKKNYNKN
jgi:hypothetical protein